MATIELIGSVSGQTYYDSSDILGLLAGKREQLKIGEEFTGRPETKIYTDADRVVKIRAELELDFATASKWAHNELSKEREIDVHHPKKTWFILKESQGDKVLIGNICPRMRPLHVELKNKPKNDLERQRYLNLLASVFHLYLTLAKCHGYKLDEGLSNFATDDKENIYYLDDEIYPWDNFVSFSIMLGVFLRNYAWLDCKFINNLTDILIEYIDTIFSDPHCRVIVSTQLHSLFMPTEDKQALLKELIKGLSKTPIIKVQKKKKPALKKNNSRFIAVMADIHANFSALENVLKFYEERKITQGVILGDIVGYGPDPALCIEKLQETQFEIIKGNHDHAVATSNMERGFSTHAKAAIDWTIEQLNLAHRDWLKYLPSYIKHKDWYAVHGAPIDPAFFFGYVYLMTAEDNLNYLQNKKISICFHGHSHMPGIFGRDKSNMDHHLTESRNDLKKFTHLLACPGSVGQPRNGNPNAQCAVFDREKLEFNIYSIPYSVESVVLRMKKNDLPEKLWQRLKSGH